MINRQFYTLKFYSSWLREYKFNINITFEEALKSKKVIALSDNQMLRIIRDETKHEVDMDYIETLFEQRDKIRLECHNKENMSKLKYLQKHIYDILYIPEYITIVMESDSDYDFMYKKGLLINGKKYVRTSCSASQGRVSTVVFVEENVSTRLIERLDNNRDKNVKLIPSKYNAYLGTASSATKIVSTPRACIIPDCLRTRDTKVYWVTETPNDDDDDIIEEITIPVEFNLFDGNGLISPEKAQEWADELGLDYLPAQWCIRANFTKGMLAVYDFHEFCKECNNGNYLIETLYKDEYGNPKIVDLRDYDVILTESQFKLWNAFESYHHYEQNCIENGLHWGVSIFTPKHDKDILTLNYQFCQTLNLNEQDVKDLCSQTVEWLKGVSYENMYYTMLFLMGTNITEEKIKSFLNSSNNYWLKSLIINHDLINDKYIKGKIYDNMKAKLENACIGKLIVDGNFQVIVPDSFAFMQHACGLEVTGLLKAGEFYSNYWNERNVTEVDAMRSPLTYLSEHNILKIKNDKLMQKWFKYYYTGMVGNVHDEHTLRFAGSDYDYDIIASSSNKTMKKGVYKNELPVVYKPPKGEKKIITQDDLVNSDKFTFGSIIGRITNDVTIIRTLMANFPEDSKEYKTLLNRMRMGCKMQSAQIDKAKIGRKVKGIPTKWERYNKIHEDDSEEVKEEKRFLNSLLCDKHPYFFRHLYKSTMSKYNKYYRENNEACKIRFGMDIGNLQLLENKTDEQNTFLEIYNKLMPVMDNDSVMNMICHYMESVKFDIKNNIKNNDFDLYYDLLLNNDVEFNQNNYNAVLKLLKVYLGELKETTRTFSKNKFDESFTNYIDGWYDALELDLDKVCTNRFEVTNYLVDIFYKKHPSYNKNILWRLCGKYIYKNVVRNSGNNITIPYPSVDGEIKYLGKNYKLQEVIIND